jgi:hypothetical protein
MARFNPQAFLAGMQSLMAPQQQADQQIAQMRMQQMDRAREQENALNQRMLQGQQMRLQQVESDRATERFALDREAAARQKKIDERNTKAFDLGQDKERTAAVEKLRAPILEKQTAYDAAVSNYNKALQNPNLISRADWNKVTGDLTTAASALNNAYNASKFFLPFMSPQFKLDDAALGTAPQVISPLSREDAIRQFRSKLPAAPTSGVQKTDVGIPGTGIDVPPPTEPATQTASGMSFMDMISPMSMGAGVSAPSYIGAVAPPKTLKGTPPKPAAVTYTPPPPRKRLYPQPTESFLDPKDLEAVQALVTGYEGFAAKNFRGDVFDKNIDNKWNDFLSDPNVMKRYLAPTARTLRAVYGDDIANSILSEFETQVLEQIGQKALMPTALVDNLTKLEQGRLGLSEDQKKAAHEADMRPLRKEELIATIAKLKAAAGGGGKGAVEWKYSDENSAQRLAGSFGLPAMQTLNKFIDEHKQKLDALNAEDPDVFEKNKKTAGTKTQKMQAAYDDAVAARATILGIQQRLRSLTGNPNKFYPALKTASYTKGLKTPEVQQLLYGVDVYGTDDSGSGGGGLDPFDLNRR